MRTTPLIEGEPKWDWETKHAGQCTWYCYYDAITANGYAPCYNNRAKKIDGYNNGKEWLKNFKEPYMPFYFADSDKMPSANDYLVFDGTYGHVVKIEAVEGSKYLISQYNLKAPKEFSNDYWTKGAILKGYPYNTGKPLGFLHAPQTQPVKQDKTKNQVVALVVGQNLRNKPSLKGEVISMCYDGYFNVYETKKADGYTWYRIDKDTWIAGIKGRVEYIDKSVGADYQQKYEELHKLLIDIKEKIEDYE